MTVLRHMPGDSFRAMMEFDRCKDDPIVWRSMVLAILLEREELLLHRATSHKWIIACLWAIIVSWAIWGAVIYKLVQP